jgi:zinc transport system ATP-binding protein
MEKAIDVKNLHFKYDRAEVLKSINLELCKNGFYVFLGPNGGGKTSLIKLIMGLESPSSGSIKVFGKNPKNHPCKFGYIPQKLNFDTIFPLCVFEFVQQGLLAELPWHGIWPKSTKERTKLLLEQFNLKDLKDAPIGDLSGGQLQRAIIARALINDPEFLILDEPLSGLDQASAQYIISLLSDLKGKKTIILITHVITHLLNKADSVFLLEKSLHQLKDKALCKHIELGLFHTHEEGCNHE